MLFEFTIIKKQISNTPHFNILKLNFYVIYLSFKLNFKNNFELNYKIEIRRDKF